MRFPLLVSALWWALFARFAPGVGWYGASLRLSLCQALRFSVAGLWKPDFAARGAENTLRLRTTVINLKHSKIALESVSGLAVFGGWPVETGLCCAWSGKKPFEPSLAGLLPGGGGCPGPPSGSPGQRLRGRAALGAGRGARGLWARPVPATLSIWTQRKAGEALCHTLFVL